MSTASLSIKFDGPAVDAHEIDVRDLAPALLSFGELVQEANRIANGERTTVAVKVKAARPGSFDVVMALDISWLHETTLTLLHSIGVEKDNISAAKDLVDMILSIGGPAGAGILLFIGWLRSRKPERVEPAGNVTNVYVGGQHLTVNSNALKLSESVQARKAIAELMKPLRTGGIRSMTFSADGDERRTVEVDQSEEPYFEMPTDEIALGESVVEIMLKIIQMSFDGRYLWRVSDGGEPYTVSMEDDDFLRKIDSKEIAFAKGDYLRCVVRQKQTGTMAGLKVQRSILKVLDHVSDYRQINMF